jgi:transcriptional regulator with XRE-family HTH domain
MADNAIDWRALLEQAVEAAGRGGVSRIAGRLGVSRSYVSQVLNNLRPNVPQQFVDRVIDRLHVVSECPATLQAQPRSECRRIALGTPPTHNPLSLRIWQACQRCAHKPEEKR